MLYWLDFDSFYNGIALNVYMTLLLLFRTVMVLTASTLALFSYYIGLCSNSPDTRCTPLHGTVLCLNGLQYNRVGLCY